MLLLNKALRQQRWNPQGSGVEVPESIAEVLHQLWQSGETKHSLRQYMEWSAADPKESRPVWLKSYKTLADRVRAVREGLEPLDSSLLEQLWLTKDNGVSSLRQGVMARQEFDAQHGVILEMTRSVLAAPTDETFQRVLTRWKEGVQAGDFNMNRPAMIRRVFAACAPERYTTLLKAEDCQQLLQGLESQFQLKASSVASVDSWCEFNRQLKECLSSAQLEELADLESNIALWQMLEAMQGRNAMDECDESQGAQGMISDQVPLNQILFGPPGTGKTFHTVNSALAILAPDVLAENEGDSPVEREVLKDTFDRLVAERQIRFVTFHQSFSYEDFVEGLRAVSSDDGGQPDYRVEPGVFKQICIDAAGDSELGVEAFNAALERLREQVEAAGRLEAQTPRGNRFAFEYVGGEAFRVYPQASQNQGYPYRASVADMLRLYRTGDSSLMHNSSYVQGILQYLRQECDLPDCIASGGSDQSTKKYVLIIDEINRGNVSRIFGELITLIEESKRAGKPEALSAVLPYSKDVFTVPDNVYIIGTMNTADRSLAGLDMALRRRFVFQEMPPRPELLADVDVQGINVGELLKTMNQRIEVLLDRDHCLGHSYFLPLKQDGTLSKLAAIFRSQILPLLQEYFFDDWQRIQWVLNDHRKAAPERFVIMEKPDLDSLFGNIDVAAQGGTWRVNSEAFLREDAYKGVLSTKLLHTEHEGFAAGTGA
jgi:5-methylcytosine-specific restriction protein B